MRALEAESAELAAQLAAAEAERAAAVSAAANAAADVAHADPAEPAAGGARIHMTPRCLWLPTIVVFVTPSCSNLCNTSTSLSLLCKV